MPMGDFLKTLAGGLLTASAKEAYTMGESNKYAKEQMKYSEQLGELSQRNSPLNQLLGLQRAGLSPALMSGVSSGSASGPSPVGTHATPSSFSPLEVIGMLNQSKLANAQANLLDAQAENINFDIGEKYGERITLDNTARAFLNNEIKQGSKWSPAYQKILADNSAITGGTMRGIAYWQNFLNTNDTGKAQSIANAFVNEVYRQQSTNGAAKILATMPHRDLERFAMDMTLDNARVSNLISSTDVNKSTLPHLAADTYRLLTEADSRYHKDFAAMWNKSDYSSMAASLFASAIQSAATGAGLYMGAKGAGFGARAASGRLAPTTQKGFDAIMKTGFEGKKLQKKVSPLSSLSQGEQNRRILSYY